MKGEALERDSGMATIPNATDTDGGAAQIYQVRQIKAYRSKRVIDFIVASIGLLLAAPFAGIIALLVRVSGPGSAVFKQTRIGKDGKEFSFYKFRSMQVDCDDSSHRQYMKLFIEGNEEELTKLQRGRKTYKMTGDDRVTMIGKFLRRTSLDELPQLLNVLRGEMSIVGPRPHIPYEVDMYKDWHRRRLKGTPGITGWWQIHGRSRVTFDESVKMDIWYLERQSIILDIRIMLRTITKTIIGRGAC
jgi:lipopolysaccharide/colanic/teichoic acid biosynthesis glycosyltransferase